MAGEQVFVVERSEHFAGEWPQGFVPLAGPAATALCEGLRTTGFFTPREAAERDPSRKQLIPYCVIFRAGEVFVVQRTSGQSETRLHGCYSIGLGGHIGPEDKGPEGRGPEGIGADLFERALHRELREELAFASPPPAPRLIGLLNDDSTDVGRVHAGLVYRLDLAPGTGLEVREIRKMSGGFRSIPPGLGDGSARRADPSLARVVETSKLWQDSANFESWSRLLLQPVLHQAGATRDRSGSAGRPS